MKASIAQVKTGLGHYVDNEILPHLSGAKRFGAAMYISLAMAGADSKLEQLLHHPAIEMLDIMEDGGLDVDKIHMVALERMPAGEKLDVDFPFIGRFSFTRADVDRLYDYILQA